MISLENVSKRYGRMLALDGVSFGTVKGKITGLLGRNGAGKTTALNLMSGFLPPSSGRVLVDGMDMMERPRECKRLIGYLPEKPPLYEEMTVRDYLRFVCDLREVAPRGREKHIDEILGVCALGEVRERVIGHLSRGYRQRTGIAQALCGIPEILLLDEPSAGLDPTQAADTRKLIRELGKDHTILFSSHMLTEVQQICDRAVILHEGKVIRSFDLRENREQNQIRLRLDVAGEEQTLLPALRSLDCVRRIEKLPAEEEGTLSLVVSGAERDARGRMTDQLFRLLAALDCPIRRMTPERDDLEAVFLEATSR